MRLVRLLAAILLVPSLALAAPRNIVSFDTNDASELAAALTGTASFSTTNHNGGYSLRVNPAGATASYGQVKCLSAAGAVADCNASALYIRFWFRYTTISTDAEKVLQVTNSGGTAVAFLTVQSAGTLFKLFNSGFSQAEYYDYSTFSGGFNSGTWYRIELFINQSGDAWTMKINGTQVMNGSGTDFGVNDIDSIEFGRQSNVNSSTTDWYYDDISISDSAFPGDGVVTMLVPNANGGTHQWTSGTGTSGFGEIDEATASDADYVATGGSANQVSRFGIKTLDGTSSIAVIKPMARMKEASSSSGSQVGTYSNTTETLTTAANPSTTFTYYGSVHATDPATASAWTESGLDALQLEIKQSTAVVGTVSHGFVMVDHVGGSIVDDSATGLPPCILAGVCQ